MERLCLTSTVLHDWDILQKQKKIVELEKALNSVRRSDSYVIKVECLKTFSNWRLGVINSLKSAIISFSSPETLINDQENVALGLYMSEIEDTLLSEFSKITNDKDWIHKLKNEIMEYIFININSIRKYISNHDPDFHQYQMLQMTFYFILEYLNSVFVKTIYTNCTKCKKDVPICGRTHCEACKVPFFIVCEYCKTKNIYVENKTRCSNCTIPF